MSREMCTAVIVFDGVCVLCNGWVHFLLKHDRQAHFRFASMQSAAGRALLQAHHLDPDDPTSFLLIDQDGAWTDTAAIARVFAQLGAWWRPVAVLIRLVPARLRDRAYRLIARNRYRWFGRHAQCLLPTPQQRTRFLN